jgi:hypothetical protein
MYSFSVSMVRRRISEAQRWQIIGMHTTGMSFKAIGRHLIRPSVTWSRNWLSSDQWILHHVLKFQSCRAKHHAKRDRRAANSGCLMTLLFLLTDVYWAASVVISTSETSCNQLLSPISTTSHKACVYGWQHQASSFKSNNRLPPKRSSDFCSLASHEPGFESYRAYLGHVRPSYACSRTHVQKIRQLEAALHREWQQLSQQDIRRLTGGMRRRVEAIIQARGVYTRCHMVFWTPW